MIFYVFMVISIANLKGGVGKTITSIYLSLLLSEFKKVLLVDVDKQANASKYFVELSEIKKKNLLNFLKTKKFKQNTIKVTNNLTLLPATLQLAQFGEHFSSVYGKEQLFKLRLSPTLTNFNYVILDNPPDLSMLNVNSLIISDIVLIPINIEEWAVDGARSIRDNLNELVQTFDIKKPQIYILPTMIQNRYDKKQLKEVSEFFDKPTLLDPIKYITNLEKYKKERKVNKKLLENYKKSFRGVFDG